MSMNKKAPRTTELSESRKAFWARKYAESLEAAKFSGNGILFDRIKYNT